MLPMDLIQNVNYQRQCRKGLTPKIVVEGWVQEKQHELNVESAQLRQALENGIQETLVNLSSILQKLKEYDPTLVAQTQIGHLTQSVEELSDHRKALNEVMKQALNHFSQAKERNLALKNQLELLRNAKKRKDSQGSPFGNFLDGLSNRACNTIANQSKKK